MIAFEDQLTSSIKDAMRAKAQVRLDVLRAMKSALKYKDVEKKQAGVSEEEALAVFQSMIKQRKESLDQYEKAGRDEQAAKEKLEIAVISEFLPQPLTESELAALISEAVKASGAQGAQDMGKVMKELKSKVLGRADNKIVSDLVRQALQG
jgi:uncharacterized protein YqeY